MSINHQNIFIIDDDIEVCKALRWLFESLNFHVETYTSAQLFLDTYRADKQGCLIIDVRLPIMGGLELLDYLKAQKNQIPIIMMTGYGDIPLAVRAMKAGAQDFILKPINHHNLLETVQKCIDMTIKKRDPHNIDERVSRLSPREKQVIDLLLNGKLNKEIAYELSISMSTVEAHRANIMQKMGAKNIAQLIKLYLQYQLDNEIC